MVTQGRFVVKIYRTARQRKKAFYVYLYANPLNFFEELTPFNGATVGSEYTK